MSLVKIIAFAVKELKLDKDGNAIIKLPPGSKRIMIQGEKKETDVEDVQTKTILKAIDELRTELVSKIDSLEVKVDANTMSIDANTALIRKYHPEGK